MSRSTNLDASPVFICQRSGFKLPISEMVIEWTGLRVGKRFVDKRNPQDFVTGVRDDPGLRISSPEPDDTFVVGNGPSQSDL